MLRIVIPACEFFNEGTEEFVMLEELVVDLEHSLASLSKWESQWEIAFLGKAEKTEEQVISYIKMMIIRPEPAPEIHGRLTADNITAVNNYIKAEMTATRFNEMKPANSGRETITAELIYHWMIALGIPLECENWHLNRLLTLIKVCNLKNAPKRKMSRAEISRKQSEMNAQRRAQMGTRG